MTEGESTEDVIVPSAVEEGECDTKAEWNSPTTSESDNSSSQGKSTLTSDSTSSTPSSIAHSWSKVDTPSDDGVLPPPPPRSIVHPPHDASESTTSMDRALLASLRAAADASDAAEAATEAASLLLSRDEGMESSGGGAFAGEAGIVRGHEPKPVEIDTKPLPPRRQGREGRREIVKTSPAVRTLAARLGVDLDSVKPTGEGGRVTQIDVQSAAARSNIVPSSKGGKKDENRSAEKMVYPAERNKIPEVTKVDFGRTRKVMYRAMGDMAQVPHFG